MLTSKLINCSMNWSSCVHLLCAFNVQFPHIICCKFLISAVCIQKKCRFCVLTVWNSWSIKCSTTSNAHEMVCTQVDYSYLHGNVLILVILLILYIWCRMLFKIRDQCSQPCKVITHYHIPEYQGSMFSLSFY
jgi:hypothetical protein